MDLGQLIIEGSSYVQECDNGENGAGRDKEYGDLRRGLEREKTYRKTTGERDKMG